MWSMQMSGNRLRRAQRAGKLLGVSTQAHQDVDSEDWLFEMVLRLARRVDSLERQLQAQAADELTAQAQEDGDY